jgi:nucleotide-binding universal stress UspA family protein
VGRFHQQGQLRRIGAAVRLRKETKVSNHAFRIVAGFDGTPESERALRLAFDQAGEHPLSRVHVVQVLPHLRSAVSAGAVVGMWGAPLLTPSVQEMRTHQELKKQVQDLFDAWAETRLNWIGRIEVHTRIDLPADGILRLAEEVDADLIVVGTHGRRGFRRFLLGSVAEMVIREAPCPVLVARVGAEDSDREVEPPCPDCIDVRFASGGKRKWCERHGEQHPFGQPTQTASPATHPEVSSL